MSELKRPVLFNGARVAVIGPSSPADGKKIDAGLESMRKVGLEPVEYPSLRAVRAYFSGDDATRAKDINDAFSDPSIDGIIAIRGGYGAARLLPLIDFDSIARNPKFFGGYSDITALHIAFTQRCGFITYHIPMPSGAPYDVMDGFSKASLSAMLFGTKADYSNPAGRERTMLCAGKAEGPLCGGNLSLIAASIGTPYELDTRGKILFIEDVGEEPYTVDRMLTQLRNSGKLADAAGIILGDWTNCEPKKEKVSLTMDEVFYDLIVPEGKPTIKGVVCGHCEPSLSLPLGARFALDADAMTFCEV